MDDAQRSAPSHTIRPSPKLAGWRKLAAVPRQLYPVARMGLGEVGGLAAENRVGHDPQVVARRVVPEHPVARQVIAQAVAGGVA